MRKNVNVIIKSMLRQPMRTFLLIFLIALGTFTFVLRTVEYLAVRAHIMEIGDDFRTVGFVQHPHGGHGDVAHVADILWKSGFLETENRNITFEGILADMTVIDYLGMQRDLPDASQSRITDAYFYGVIYETIWSQGVHWVVMRVGHVYAGMPQHVVEGQIVFMEFDADLIGSENAQALQSGERFLFRGRYIMRIFQQDTGNPFIVIPQTGNPREFIIGSSFMINLWEQETRTIDPLVMMPINEEEGIWFVPANNAQNLDFANKSGLEHLPNQITFLNNHQRSMQVTFTSDLTISADFAGEPARLRNVQGRPLNHEDYIEGRNVVYIERRFATYHGLYVGSNLTLYFHEEQYISGAIPFLGIPVAGSTIYSNRHAVEFEVVGTFSYWGRPISHLGFVGRMPATFVFAPASAIPAGVSLAQPDYLAEAWYSFTLSDPTQVQEFLIWVQEQPELYNYNIVIMSDTANSLSFLATAQTVLMVNLFNALLFWVVVLVVLGLVGFVFTFQRKKDFAIYRALGISKATISWHMVKALLFFAIPSAIAGGIGGWLLARRAVATALEPFATFLMDYVITHPMLRPPPPQVIEFDVGLGVYWLAGLTAVVIAALFIITAAIVRYMLHTPALVALQGNSVRAVKQFGLKKYGKIDEDMKNAPNTTAFKEFVALEKPLPTAPLSKLAGAAGWVFRHIRRNVLKSALGLAVALIFVVAIGWLQEAGIRNQNEIDRLNNTIIVTGSIGPSEPGQIIMGVTENSIRWRTVEMLAQHKYLLSHIYTETDFGRAFFVHNPGGEAMPQNWEELSGIDTSLGIMGNLDRMETLRGFNRFEDFVARNTDFWGNTIQFEFGAGFSEADFAGYERGDRVPIIMPQSTLEEKGLNVGDYVNIGFFILNISRMETAHARIIGTHNSHILSGGNSNISLIPTAALEYVLGGFISYSVLSFAVDTIHNPQIDRVRETLEVIPASFGGLRNLSMHLFLQDEELRNTTTAVGQTILLLDLMYPVALAISATIAIGLSMLLMLQSAKNAATMRVLGTGKSKTQSILTIELLAVCIGGLLMGILWLVLAAWGLGAVAILSAAGIYLVGSVLGAVIGVALTTRKPPLELLQVRE
ncbi:MAG: ABC transporter permease [Defluviitaleaceae bacterium]|nr:ABC transporter permease [Defluviitaleaceae bacterium]